MSGPPQPRRRPPLQNVSSILLADHENNILFGMLGRKCVALASGVVQVYLAQNSNTSWQKRCTGVCCFIKDNPNRSYFIRVYSIKKGEKIWEQELYNQFKYNTPRSYFHTFDTDHCRAGLNFASEKEALQFKKVVEEKIRQKHEKRQGSQAPQSQYNSSHHGHNATPMHSITPQFTPQTDERKSKKKKGKKGKLSKADISMPSGFKHVGHVGWDPNKGFDTNNMDPDVKELFHSAGITESDMQDQEKAQFIYDFIEQKGGIEAIKQDQQRARQTPPPPPPSRSGPPPPSRSGPPPPSRSGPPPPNRSGAPPPPQRGASVRAPPPPQHRHPQHAYESRNPPQQPPPFSNHYNQEQKMRPSTPSQPPSSGAPPPPAPPPPPPAPVGVPAPPPPPPSAAGGSLMSQIQQGRELKSASDRPAPSSGGGGGRDALLEAIRKGKDLKTVSADASENSAPVSSPDSGGSLANALASALLKRENAIHTDSETDSEEFDDEDWSD